MAQRDSRIVYTEFGSSYVIYNFLPRLSKRFFMYRSLQAGCQVLVEKANHKNGDNIQRKTEKGRSTEKGATPPCPTAYSHGVFSDSNRSKSKT